MSTRHRLRTAIVIMTLFVLHVWGCSTKDDRVGIDVTTPPASPSFAAVPSIVTTRATVRAL